MQITHYLEPMNGAQGGLALESWFNPIVSQSIFMPGWFEQQLGEHAPLQAHDLPRRGGGHREQRERHGRLAGGASQSSSTSPRTPTFVKLKEGLAPRGPDRAARGGQAGAAGHVPDARHPLGGSAVADLDEIGDDSDLSVNSAHPQGGNPMSKEALKGVATRPSACTAR